MATRFYYSSEEAAGASPAFGTWDYTNQMISTLPRARMVAGTKGDCILTTVEKNLDSTADASFLIRQYVSDPLKGQNVAAGTIKGQLQGYKMGNLKASFAFNVRVCDHFGNITTTLVGTTWPTTTAMPPTLSSSSTNRHLRNTASDVAIAYPAFTIPHEGRIIVELGCFFPGKCLYTSDGIRFNVGYHAEVNDLPEDDTSTSALCPWIEFSQTLDLSTPVPTEYPEMWVLIDGVWKRAMSIYVLMNGAWKNITSAGGFWSKTASGWKQVDWTND